MGIKLQNIIKGISNFTMFVYKLITQFAYN
jgi:hypothetical protein